MALGTASLGAAWRVAVDSLGVSSKTVDVIQPVLTGVGIAFLLFFLCKSLAGGVIIQDLKDPRPLSAGISTAGMATMVIGASLSQYDGSLGAVVWRCGFVLHLALMANFVFRRIEQFLKNPQYVREWWISLTPAWYVVFVGNAAGAAGYGAVKDHISRGELLASLWIGLGFLIVLKPIITYRILFAKRMHNYAMYSLAIYMAPASLVLSAWLGMEFRDRDHWATRTLFGVSVFTALVVYGSAYLLLVKLPARTEWSSYTFPGDIVAVAMMRFYNLYPDSKVMQVVATFAFVVANLVVFAVFLVFLKAFFSGNILLQYDKFVFSRTVGPPEDLRGDPRLRRHHPHTSSTDSAKGATLPVSRPGQQRDNGSGDDNGRELPNVLDGLETEDIGLVESGELSQVTPASSQQSRDI